MTDLLNMEAREDRSYKVGDIYPSIYTYGDEVRLVKFFMVTKNTGASVTLQELQTERKYYGRDAEEQKLVDEGRSYYDTPCTIEPISDGEYYFPLGRAITRKIKDYIKTGEYWYLSYKWSGRPLEIYNLH